VPGNGFEQAANLLALSVFVAPDGDGVRAGAKEAVAPWDMSW
jgi:hypothetical protein